MLSSLSSFFGDGRAAVVASGVAVLVIAGLAFWVYRLAFAHRLRPPGASRGRAPRLGVVDVFGLDGQRQLVIVRRDNVEHLLLLGGPNDIVVEPNISRNAANGRDAGKSGAPSELALEPIPPLPAPAAAPPRPAAALRRNAPARPAPADAPAPADPVVVLSETRARPASIPRPAADTPREPPRSEPVKLETIKTEAKPELFRAVLTPDVPKPAIAVEPPVKPVEPAPAAEPVARAAVEAPRVAVEPAARAPVEAPRRSLATPRPVPASARAALPPPITPLRSRSATDTGAEPVKPAPAGEVVTLKPMEPTAPSKPVEAPVAVKPAVEAPQAAVRPKKDDTFYDLESLEAEMARLLGRDP